MVDDDPDDPDAIDFNASFPPPPGIVSTYSKIHVTEEKTDAITAS